MLPGNRDMYKRTIRFSMLAFCTVALLVALFLLLVRGRFLALPWVLLFGALVHHRALLA